MTYLRGLLVALCALAVLAPVASASVTVNLRVEGANETLFEGPITTDARTIDAPDADGNVEPRPCNYRDNANGGAGDVSGTPTTAVYDAMRDTGQSFEATWYSGFEDLAIDRLGPDGSNPLYWGFAVDNVEAQVGGCQIRLDGGDEVLWALDIFGKPLLKLDGPTSARVGEQVTYTVRDGRDGSPVGDAVVGGRSTNGDGRVELTYSDTGERVLKAEKAGTVRSNAVELDVVAADAIVDPAAPPAAPGAPGTTAGPLPAGFDLVPPRAAIAALDRGDVFSSRRAPKLLKGTVAESGVGVLMVKLRLTRTTPGKRCQAYSGKRERFIRRPKCGADQGWWFKIGTTPAWEYELPSQLRAGRYVLDVNVIDKAFNRDDTRRPGENRVVFHVR